MNPFTVYAVDLNDPNVNPLQKFSKLSDLINLLLPLLMTGGALIFLVMLLRGAYTWLTAGGSPEQVARAQKLMTFAVIGLIIVVASFTAVKLIGVIFQVGDKLPF